MENTIKVTLTAAWPSLVVLLSIYIIMRLTMYFNGERRSFVLHEEVFRLLFIAYLLVFFRLVTSQDLNTYTGTNFIPFREILRYDIGTLNFHKQVLGNILLFIPFGYFVSCYCKIKRLGPIVLVSFLSSLVIEVVQHFIGRSFDVDDIILNVVGGVIGFLIYISLSAIYEHLPKFLKKDWLLNIVSILLIAVVALYLFKII